MIIRELFDFDKIRSGGFVPISIWLSNCRPCSDKAIAQGKKEKNNHNEGRRLKRNNAIDSFLIHSA